MRANRRSPLSGHGKDWLETWLPYCAWVLGAFLTTVFFSLSSICANRAIRSVGPARANLGRLFVAFVFLASWAHLLPLLTGTGGTGLAGAGRDYFLLSGLIGMGLGDMAVFAALPRLGARLTVVVTQCLAAPLAALTEWLWLGTHLKTAQVVWSCVVLAGVAVALSPSKRNPPRVAVTSAGVLFGILAAAGQGVGAAVSRKAYELSRLAGESIDGMTATYQRLLGGIAVTVLLFAAYRILTGKLPDTSPNAQTSTQAQTPAATFLTRWRWTLANGLCGPVLGVSCYQWALGSTPSGLVLPIVATTPIVTLPLSYWIDGERPTYRSVLGSIIAVGGVVALTFVR